jgi:hypothetical protein
MSLFQGFHSLVLSALVYSIYGQECFGLFLFISGLIYFIAFDTNLKSFYAWTSILTKITTDLAYYRCLSFIHSTSRRLRSLLNPIHFRYPFQRPRRTRHTRHYYLRIKVSNRRYKRPRRLSPSGSTFQATNPTRTSPNQVSRPTYSTIGILQKLHSTLQSLRLPTLATSQSSKPMKHHSKYNKDNNSPGNLPTTKRRSKYAKDFDNKEEEDPRGKSFKRSFSVSNICQHLDFIQMHRLLTLFYPLKKEQLDIVDTVNEELSTFRKFLYTSDTPHHSVGPTNVFMSSLDQRTIPIVIDSGASKGLSPIRSDFIQFRQLKSKITGIGAQSEIGGVGIVRWKIIDQHGKVDIIETEAYYVPSAHIRLYSPQSHFVRHKKGNMTLNWEETTLKLPNSSQSLSFPYDQYNALPLMILAPGDSEPAEAMIMEENFGSDVLGQEDVESGSTSDNLFLPQDCSSDEINCAITDEQNVNLSKSQLELLGWHYKFGHVNMQSIQRLMHPSKALDNEDTSEKLGHPKVLATKQDRTHSCEIPKCASCILGKMERMPKSTTFSKGSKDKHSLKGNDLLPGARISLDQYVLTVKGRSIRNSSINSQKYNGGTIFVDHASGRIFNHHQVSLRAGETLIGKRMLEREARDLGFKLQGFLADNGVFKADEFQEDVHRKNQSIRFSGVGAHHQNGVAERAIKTISYLTRTNLIHSAIRWPGQNDLELWPLAFDHSVYIYNNLPSQDGLSPQEKWSSTKFFNYDHLRRLHPWGCPAYVLDPKLQDGKKLPKWSPRSRQGKFVGISKEHASTVALVLNPSTKRISPQFHVLFDDFFSTVRSVDDTSAPVLTSTDWDSFLEMKGTEVFYDESEIDHIPPISNEWLEPEEIQARRQPQSQQPLRQRENTPNIIDLTSTDNDEQNMDEPASVKIEEDSNHVEELAAAQGGDQSVSDGSEHQREQSVEYQREQPVQQSQREQESQADNLPHRTRRPRRLNKKYFNDDFVNLAEGKSIEDLDPNVIPSFYSTAKAEGSLRKKYTGYDQDQEHLQSLDWNQSVAALASSATSFQAQQFFTEMESFEDPITGLVDEFHPLAFVAKAADEDNPNWFEATNGSNSDGFWEAMWKEMITLQKIGAWEQVPRSEAPKVILSTWAFKIKRFPSGLVRKLKARFCVRGDMQKEGIDVFETFAPVVSWTTIRLLLILSVILDLKTTQVDYTSAFCQAPMDHDVFVAPPKGWQHLNKMGLPEAFKPDHVLKLKRSLYGQKDAPRIFFEYLKQNLLKCGYKQSEFDPCLFISEDVICLVYVDDCLFFSKSQDSIDKSIEKIRKVGMQLNVEDDVAGFLGVHIDHNDDGTVRLTQTGLIDRVILAMGLEDANPKGTPAPRESLGRDLKGNPFSQEFNYASVVGMLMYLCNNTRPEIAFAVNQCARYTHFPTEKHGNYLKHIGKYLKGTRGKGLILNPKRNDPLKIDCYADANYAGLWNSEEEQDPHCVRSRTGFIVMIANCPVIWKSKLQTEIALSTMESEYIALSMSCRDLLPLQNLVSEVAEACGASEGGKMTIQSTIFEDNEPCKKLALMELPRMTNRSKHIAVKYHWFRSRVNIDWIVESIPTKEQLADIFTKSLAQPDFERLRFTIMG